MIAEYGYEKIKFNRVLLTIPVSGTDKNIKTRIISANFETFPSLSLGNSWESSKDKISDMVAGFNNFLEQVKVVAFGGDLSNIAEVPTTLTWTGSNEISFNLELIFFGENKSWIEQTDIDKVKSLMRLNLSRGFQKIGGKIKTAGLLAPPGFNGRNLKVKGLAPQALIDGAKSLGLLDSSNRSATVSVNSNTDGSTSTNVDTDSLTGLAIGIDSGQMNGLIGLKVFVNNKKVLNFNHHFVAENIEYSPSSQLVKVGSEYKYKYIKVNLNLRSAGPLTGDTVMNAVMTDLV